MPGDTPVADCRSCYAGAKGSGSGHPWPAYLYLGAKTRILTPSYHLRFTIHMMKSLGRLLQIGGLILLPLAMLMELSGQLGRRGVAELLLMLVVGAAAFALGRFIEGYAR